MISQFLCPLSVDSATARYSPFLKNKFMEGSVNKTCDVHFDKMSKQLWLLKMSSHRAWAECQIIIQRVRHSGLLYSHINNTNMLVI